MKQRKQLPNEKKQKSVYKGILTIPTFLTINKASNGPMVRILVGFRYVIKYDIQMLRGDSDLA